MTPMEKHTQSLTDGALPCPACAARYPSTKVIVVGPGDIHAQLETAAQRLGVPLIDLVQAYKEANPLSTFSSTPSEYLFQKIPEPEEKEPFVPKKSLHCYQSVKERNHFFEKKRGRR